MKSILIAVAIIGVIKSVFENGAGADHVRSAGGIAAILKKARGRDREALKAADETLPDDVQDFDGGEEPDETRTGTSAAEHGSDEIFDAEKDLSIRVGSETLERVLGQEIDMDEPFYLECRKSGPLGRDWIRIVAILVDVSSD